MQAGSRKMKKLATRTAGEEEVTGVDEKAKK